MRRASEGAFPPTPATIRPRRWAALAGSLALLLLLAACRTAPPAPQTEPQFDMQLELAMIDLPVLEQHRVRFLPPLAKGMPGGDFVADMQLEIRLFNVDPATGVASGAALGPTYSTADGGIANKRGAFSLTWSAASLRSEPLVSEHLRAEIRLPGGPDAPVCNQLGQQCLGYLDIFMFKGSAPGRHQAPAGFVPVPALVGALPIGFKVLEQEPPAENPPPSSIDQLRAVTGGMLAGGEQAPNCASPFSSRPGQGLQRVGAGLQMVGAIGGLLEVDLSQYEGPLVSPGQVGLELLGEMEVDHPKHSAVVLIVDDFDAGYELPAGLFTSGDPAAAFAEQISHGALVLHHFREMGAALLSPLGSHWQQGVGAGGQPYWAWGDGYKKLYLQVVNVGKQSTDHIPAAIEAALKHWIHKGVDDFIVNMSFAVVPCSMLEDYDGAAGMAELGIETFEEYLVALADVNDIGRSYLSELGELVSIPSNVSNDPLLRFTACPVTWLGNQCDGLGPKLPFYRLVFVASSGNYGDGYALYPAAADHVVSVGSLEPAGGGFVVSGYSNAAELGAPGGLFRLDSSSGQTVAYTGTSFAAPAVSLFLAYDSMNLPARCDAHDVGRGETPILALGEYHTAPFYTLDGSGSVVDAYCLGHD